MALFLTVERLAHGVVMVAQRHAQHFFGLLLLDDVAVEVRLDVARLVGEIEIVPGGLRLGLGDGAGRLSAGEAGCAERLELFLQEILHLFLEFVG